MASRKVYCARFLIYERDIGLKAGEKNEDCKPEDK